LKRSTPEPAGSSLGLQQVPLLEVAATAKLLSTSTCASTSPSAINVSLYVAAKQTKHQFLIPLFKCKF
jgi:hypothetical protein